jgi:hypothetical protein
LGIRTLFCFSALAALDAAATMATCFSNGYTQQSDMDPHQVQDDSVTFVNWRCEDERSVDDNIHIFNQHSTFAYGDDVTSLLQVGLQLKSHLQIDNEVTKQPYFYVQGSLNTEDPGTMTGNMFVSVETCRSHSHYVDNITQAEMIFVDGGRNLDLIWNLPVRNDTKQYVVWANGINLDFCSINFTDPTCLKAQQVLTRKDIFQVNFDLRAWNLCDDFFRTPQGVTFPHFLQPRLQKPSVEQLRQPTKYLLTSRMDPNKDGWHNSSHVRRDLQGALTNYVNDRVMIEFASPPYNFSDQGRYDELLGNTSFALIAHGDNRWSVKLTEVMGVCVIPVIMADGVTLPFEELLDWSKISIQVPEHLASDVNAILTYLPQDQEIIQEMRRRVCAVHEAMFATEEARLDGLLFALESHRSRTATQFEPQTRPELSEADAGNTSISDSAAWSFSCGLERWPPQR